MTPPADLGGVIPRPLKLGGTHCRSPVTFEIAKNFLEAAMGKCAQCGNDYDESFEVKMGGRTLVFDSFECAIQALAPVCPHCGVRIVGHGVQHGEAICCCVHCAKHEGVKGLRDRD